MKVIIAMKTLHIPVLVPTKADFTVVRERTADMTRLTAAKARRSAGRLFKRLGDRLLNDSPATLACEVEPVESDNEPKNEKE